MTSDANDLYSRNWAFITPELQHILDHTCLFAAGAGLSSTIVTLACRTGFGSFILADGDNVELSNLNRQAFFRRQIGENKATATAELLREIRPDAEVTVLPEFIENDSYAASLERANIVINSIDYDNPALFALARDARARGIPMIIPLNLGWGGAVFVFTGDSMPLAEVLGVDPSASHSAADVSGRLVASAFGGSPFGVPDYLAATLADFQTNGAQWPCEPQLGAAASLTAAMVVRAAAALAANEPIRVAPAASHIDLRILLEPSAVALAAMPGNEQAEEEVAVANDESSDDNTTAATVPAPAAVSATPETHKASASPGILRMPAPKKADDDFRVYLRSRQLSARYPALTAIATKGKDVLYLRNRPSGLWSYAIRHDMLSASAFNEFGEFRIDQYALAGLYDTSKIAQRGYRTDPTLADLAENAIHVLCGTAAGQILACCSIVPPRGPLYSEPTGLLVKRRRPLALADQERAVFPTETELFGRGVFESLPAIQAIPVERMREIGHLMRNQAIKTPLTGMSVFEVVYALTQILPNPKLGIDISLGNMGPEARNLMELANIPVVYAPWAQVVVAEANPDEDFWIPPTNAESYFWPFVIASADLLAISPYLQQLDSALASAAQSTRSALIAVSNLARTSGLPEPPFVAHAQIPKRWFVAPPYGPPIPPTGQSDQP
ncbi:MAG TPA: ThiF family adenylyltransferase [Ktedonobacterales bacterium]|nr:ThiF family adenylyltransferase [Ktedonobacterales bacterium]